MDTKANLIAPADLLKSLKVLYVEDDDEVRELLARFLKRRVSGVFLAANGREGIEMFDRCDPDVVVTDIKMPIMDGMEMAEAIKNTSPETPIIVVTAFSEGEYFMEAIRIGVDGYVTKPVDPDLLMQAIARGAMAQFQQRELKKAYETLLEALSATIAVLSRAIEMRDPYTDGHQKRVSHLAVAIGTDLGLTPERLTGLRFGALVHDVGKIGIPSELLTTTRRLNPPEMAIVRTHPAIGSGILGEAKFPWPVTEMVMQHHERMDGSGYPAGLKGDEILLEARILGVADVVEAMTSHRPYRPALGLDAALGEIKRYRGVRYDSQVVDACLRVMEAAAGDFFAIAKAAETATKAHPQEPPAVRRTS